MSGVISPSATIALTTTFTPAPSCFTALTWYQQASGSASPEQSALLIFVPSVGSPHQMMPPTGLHRGIREFCFRRESAHKDIQQPVQARILIPQLLMSGQHAVQRKTIIHSFMRGTQADLLSQGLLLRELFFFRALIFNRALCFELQYWGV